MARHRGRAAGAAWAAAEQRAGRAARTARAAASAAPVRQRRAIPRSTSTRPGADDGVERGHDRERSPDPRRTRDRLGGAQVTVDDPGLAADFGRDPARLHRQHRQRGGGDRGAEKPGRARQVAPPPPGEHEPDGEQRQRARGAHHHVERQVDDGRGRPVARRDRVQADDLRVGAEPGQQRRQVRDLQAARRNAVLHAAAEPLRDVGGRLRHQLDRGELHRLQLHHFVHGAVACHHLHRHREGGHRERDQEAEAVEAIAPPPQHPDRVDRRDDEAGAQQGGEQEVNQLVPERGVEDHGRRGARRSACRRASRRKPRGVFIQELAAMIENAPTNANSGSGRPRRKCVCGLSRSQPKM